LGSLAVALLRAAPADAEIGERMLRAAPHRGDETEVVVYGDTVLAVAADSELGDAALARDDGLVAAFAGSIDNRVELERELSRVGVSARGENPAEVVLAAFRQWGDDAVARMRGSFAGAVSDGNSLQCFRDQLGWQTFFHRDGEPGFFAATEAKQVLAGARARREPDLDAVTDIFYGGLGTQRTALRDIERFPVASIAKVGRSRGVASRRYWDPSSLFETARLSVPEARERLAELLDQAVRRSLSGRDALLLSGGVDSPTLAAFAAPWHLELGGRPLTAISAVYPDQPEVDESRYIELVAKDLGLRLHTFVQSSSAVDELSHWVDVLDGPWAVLPVQEVAEVYRIARDLDARRVLSGEMAEPVATGGGPLFGHLLFHGRGRAAVRFVRGARARGRSPRAMAQEILPSITPALLATRLLRLRSAQLGARKAAFLPDWVDRERVPGSGVNTDYALPIRSRWRHRQLSPALAEVGPSQEADDLCAARIGVQVRLPFADVDLWEFFLSLPAEVKFPDLNTVSKSLVRQTMRGRLPDEILDRRSKTYFADHIAGSADYDGLSRYILGSAVRIDGVDYARLADRLERRDLGVNDVVWAQDLARAHAFLGLFE
jgi:asparagine synthase (glutamine-hydrolysing)